jgi:hypothetical protein
LGSWLKQTSEFCFRGKKSEERLKGFCEYVKECEEVGGGKGTDGMWDWDQDLVTTISAVECRQGLLRMFVAVRRLTPLMQ